MLLDFIPTVVIVFLVGWFIRQHRGMPVLQLHALIAASYLNIFPALDYVFAGGQGMSGFAQYQWMIIVFFQVPLMAVAHQSAGRLQRGAVAPPRSIARLSPWVPLALAALLLAFWYVALQYDLFYRRLGHEGLQRNSAEVPGLLLYCYRGAVETAFFVIVFLCTCLRGVKPESRHYRLYQAALIGYLATFFLFFAANSRMQFVLLLLCLVCTQPQITHFLVHRVKLLRFGLLLALLVLGLTLFRELYLEDNDRIAVDDVGDLLYTAGWLIAARLDSVEILYRLDDVGFNPWGFDFGGVVHVLHFYASFFTDPATYDAIKESLVTSPSVEIINRTLSVSEVDFPKSMILDMFLSFGATGLVVTACLLGKLLGVVQRTLVAPSRGFHPALLTSLYVLPMLLEFEKEFIGFFFAFLKWTPALVLLYWQRPRFTHISRRRQSTPAPLQDASPA